MDISYGWINDFNGEGLKIQDQKILMVKNVSRKRIAKNQKEFNVEKVLKRKGDKRYIKWKG